MQCLIFYAVKLCLMFRTVEPSQQPTTTRSQQQLHQMDRLSQYQVKLRLTYILSISHFPLDPGLSSSSSISSPSVWDPCIFCWLTKTCIILFSGVPPMKYEIKCTKSINSYYATTEFIEYISAIYTANQEKNFQSRHGHAMWMVTFTGITEQHYWLNIYTVWFTENY